MVMDFVKNNRYQIETPEGFKDFDGLLKSVEIVKILKIYYGFFKSIEVSENHIFIVNNVEIKAKDVKVGDVIESKNKCYKIKKIKYIEDDIVYTPMNVNSTNNAYIANNIIHKNCKFLGSSNTLIDADTLEELFPSDPIDLKWNGLFSIYENPIKGEKYVIGCDVSRGTGRDYSVAQVIKYRSQCELEQVATYRCNTVSPKEFSGVIASIGKMYNNAAVLVENNGYGELTLDKLWYDLEYENLINPEKKKLGVTADRRSKGKGVMLLKEYLEKEYLIVRDKDTINEIQNFEEVENHSYTNSSYACIGGNDDTVSSLIWSIYFTTLPEFDGQVSTYRIEDKYKLDDEEDKKDDEDESGPLYFFDE